MQSKSTFLTIAFLSACMFSACQKSNKAPQEKFITASDLNTSITEGVTFGNPPEGGGACAGKGICSSSGISGSQTNGTTVTFQLSPNNAGVLVLTFSLADLQAHQSAQVAYFTDPRGSYVFDGTYVLSDPIYTPLGLLPNAQIDPTCQSTVAINGDAVTVSITYTHS